MTTLLAEQHTADAAPTQRLPPERGRVSTGYRPLDEALHGGYSRGYAVLLSSPSCDERDLLLKRFLKSDAGCLTIYLTRDAHRAADLYAPRGCFQVVGCNGSRRAAGRNIVQIPGCDDLCSMGIALSSALRKVEPHMVDEQPRKLVIDVISDVLLSRRAVTTRSWLWELILRMKARGFTILGVLNPRMHPPEDVEAVVELFDGHISIEERESDGGLKRLARVRKMYACEYDRSEVELDRETLTQSSPRPLEPYPQPPSAPI